MAHSKGLKTCEILFRLLLFVFLRCGVHVNITYHRSAGREKLETIVLVSSLLFSIIGLIRK